MDQLEIGNLCDGVAFANASSKLHVSYNPSVPFLDLQSYTEKNIIKASCVSSQSSNIYDASKAHDMYGIHGVCSDDTKVTMSECIGHGYRWVKNNLTSTLHPVCSDTSKLTEQECLFSGIHSWKVGTFNSQHCSTTLDLNEPSWWWIDLGQVQHIDRVKIYGQNDTCNDCLTSASMISVRVGTSLGNHNGLSNQLCSNRSFNIFDDKAILVNCNKKGRYISIHNPVGPLKLCEVQAFGIRNYKSSFAMLHRQSLVHAGRNNVATNKPTSQSSTLSGRTSNLAVDGNSKTCSSTKRGDYFAHWTVDLETAHVIDRIHIHGDPQSPLNFYNVTIFVGNNELGGGESNSLCDYDFMQISYGAIFTCSAVGITGRFVTIIYLQNLDYSLNFCEVEILEKRVDNSVYGSKTYPRIFDNKFRNEHLGFELKMRWPEYQGSGTNDNHWFQKSNPYTRRSGSVVGYSPINISYGYQSVFRSQIFTEARGDTFVRYSK